MKSFFKLSKIYGSLLIGASFIISGCGETAPRPLDYNQASKVKLSFSDEDLEMGKITGPLNLDLADNDLTSVSEYALYWSDSLPKVRNKTLTVKDISGLTLIKSVAKSKSKEIYKFDEGEVKGKYILLFLKNAKTLANSAVYSNLKLEIEDRYSALLPEGTLSLIDQDKEKKKISGNLTISEPLSFKGYDRIILNWSADGEEKVQEINKIDREASGKKEFFNFPLATELISDYILLQTENKYGVSKSSLKLKLEDIFDQTDNSKTIEQKTAQEIKQVEQKLVVTTPVATETKSSDFSQANNNTIILLTKNIYFGYDKYSLTDEFKSQIKTGLGEMDNLENLKLTVAGHCDERGSAEYNLALGEKRALAVKNYLVALGVPVDNINTISYGKERPLDLGHNSLAWAKNRRSKISLN